jgi:hypothetical protein
LWLKSFKVYQWINSIHNMLNPSNRSTSLWNTTCLTLSQSSFTKSNIPFSSIHKINNPFPFRSNSIHYQFIRFFDYLLSTIPARLAVSSILPFSVALSPSTIRFHQRFFSFSSRHPIILQKLRFRYSSLLQSWYVSRMFL